MKGQVNCSNQLGKDRMNKDKPDSARFSKTHATYREYSETPQGKPGDHPAKSKRDDIYNNPPDKVVRNISVPQGAQTPKTGKKDK